MYAIVTRFPGKQTLLVTVINEYEDENGEQVRAYEFTVSRTKENGKTMWQSNLKHAASVQLSWCVEQLVNHCERWESIL